MATGGGLALPEPLHDEDSRSWFKRFEVCAAANGWDAAKKLLRLPTLLKGCAWAIFDSLGEDETDSYDHLKAALLKRLSPDTEEDRLTAHEQLFRRKLREGGESIDELARDLERLLDKASPGLPAEPRDCELHFHLMNSLPERVAFQLKLLPKGTFVQTIAKAKELCLIYNRSDAASEAKEIHHVTESTRLDQMEATLQSLSEQLLILNTRQNGLTHCYVCGRLGHTAKNCRARGTPPATVTCFKCGNRGHMAHNCWQQGNGRGGFPNERAWSAPTRK